MLTEGFCALLDGGRGESRSGVSGGTWTWDGTVKTMNAPRNAMITISRRAANGKAHAALAYLLLIFNSCIALVTAYLALLTAAGWRALLRGKDVTTRSEDAEHRFLIVIPAHDEEQLLATTLKSLAEVDYPRSHCSVHVVADNCNDATADVARAHGAEVHERLAPQDPGKGPALSWLLRRLWAREELHDAVVVIDADSIVSGNFLRVMDARLSQGDRVIQSHYAVRDPEHSWAASIRSAALAVRHYLRPLARTSMGGSAGLHGNGMVFSAELMHGREWTAHLTEDIAFEAELLLDGQRVAFAADAIVEAEMPGRLADAETQNDRWERGRLQVSRRYVPLLIRAAATGARGNRWRYADAAIDHLIPPLSVVAAATAVSSVASATLWLLGASRLARLNTVLALGGVGAQGAYIASGLRMVNSPPEVWRSLLGAPVFMGWKVCVWLRAGLTRDPEAWIRTPRNR